MFSRKLIMIGLAAAIAAGALALSVPVLAGEQVTADGVLHVRNGAKPSGGQRTLQCEELWRAGGDDEDVFFGIIIQAATGEDGKVYLLDLQLSEVQVFSPEGEFLQTLSREGEGPGEVRNPVDMVMLPDNVLGLVQAFPGKIIKIDLEGNPQGTFTPGGADPTSGGFMQLIDARWWRDRYVLGGVRITNNMEEGFTLRDNFVASYSPDGALMTTYADRPDRYEFNSLNIDEEASYFPHLRRWAMGNDGRIYLALARNDYAIKVYKPDGTLDRVIEREYDSWQRTEKERTRVERMLEAQTRNIPFPTETHVGDTEPDLTSLHVADDGSLWVQTSRGSREQPEGIMLTYDVFDPEGNFTEQVAVACEGDGVEDGLIFAGGDRVYLVTGLTEALIMLQSGGASGGGEESEEGEAAPMEVICYRINGST
jgi:hypothetical protein